MYLLKSPSFWEAIGWVMFILVAVGLIYTDYQKPISRRKQLVLVLSLLALLFIKRLVILFVNRELNPDESQLLSQALTLRYHPVYWKSVDGATMGPLSCYFVAIPAWFGVPLQYIVLRWEAFFCLLISVISGYFTIENFFDSRVARLASLPVVAFLAFTEHLDFLHATNEQLSLALIGVTLWQFSHIWKHQQFSHSIRMALLSSTASLVPFAKLQGTPAALIIVLFAFLGLLGQYWHVSRPVFWRSLIGLVVGGVLFPVLVVVLTFVFNVFDDFVHFYLTANLAYSAGESFWVYVAHFPLFVAHTLDFWVFLLPAGLLGIGWVIGARKTYRPLGLLLFIVALLIASGYAVIKPGNEFTHYLLYLVLPISLLTAWWLDSFRQPIHTLWWTGLIVLATAGKSVQQRATAAENPTTVYTKQPFALRQFSISPIAGQVLQFAKPGEDLVVWGWAPKYNVETQMPQGVSDNHTIRCVMGGDQRAHRERYIRNMQASQAPVFIDAVGPNSTWLTDRRRYGYETFPELRNYVQTNYRFVAEIDSTRIFVRRDRAQ